jgi:hypothetical protein
VVIESGRVIGVIRRQRAIEALQYDAKNNGTP